MSQREFTISQTALDSALENNEQEQLAFFYREALSTIKSDGIVKIEQQFSDGVSEIVALVDTQDLLELYIGRYIRK